MGYPLTFRRFVHRNGLSLGGYESTMTTVNITSKGSLTDEEFFVALAPFWREDLISCNSRWGALAGDLRRLEHDTVDENGICKHIAGRTGIDADIVAAVLKEYISW